MNRVEASTTVTFKKHVKTSSKKNYFSEFALQFAPFMQFISLYFDLSANCVRTTYKMPSSVMDDIGRMGNRRLDLLNLPHTPLKVPLLGASAPLVVI